jgi:hypothetical protein
MEIGARRAYLNAVKERYKKSSKKQKTQILNELCQVCNYNRKHAIKLLTKMAQPRPYTKRCKMMAKTGQGNDNENRPKISAKIVRHYVA